MMRKHVHHTLLAVALVSGCSAERQEGFGIQDLTRIEEAGADGECEIGGVVISSGADENRNGKLDEAEVEDARVVCDGASLADPENPELLRRVDALSDGSVECPAGGVALHSGLDDDRDRVLSDAEIDDTQIVCNTREYATLTRAVSIAVGSAECLFGGQRIEAGSDDGAGTGKADDGVLADAEVDTSYLDCNTSPPRRAESITPPAGPLGTADIDVAGGDSNNAAAGQGGSLRITANEFSGCVPAITKLFTTGTVDASFVVPSLSIDLGSEGFVVSEDTSLELFEASDLHNVNQVYYLSGSGLVLWTGSASVPVTGLRIAADATLTLPTAQAGLSFVGDVEILGTLALPNEEARFLTLQARQISVGTAGIVDASQTGVVSRTPVSLRANSQMLLRGTLLAQGAQPGLGGAQVLLSAGGRMVLEGKVDVSGADATSGGGGAGGSLRATTDFAGVWSHAEIDASGGDGPFGGGAGGSILLGYDDSNVALDLRNTGLLNASGGAQIGASCTSACAGGSGGSVILHATVANLASTGELKATGGDGSLNAGAGGSITAAIASAGTSLPDARLTVSGAIRAGGGQGTSSGAPGGLGGTFSVRNCTGESSVAELLGYQSVRLEGGSATGSGAGGAGGRFEITSFEDVPTPRRLYANVPVDASGGGGFTGGFGGTLDVSLSSDIKVTSELPAGLPSAIVDGDHSLFGGDASANGGQGGGAGDARLHVRGDLISSGSLTTSAGAGLSAQTAWDGGAIDLRSSLGSVRNSADLSANGGNAGTSLSGQGGDGGCMVLDGQEVTNAGALTARGGDGAVGGAGGHISLLSHRAPGANSGSFEVGGGGGTPGGSAGLAGFDLPSCRD